MHAQRVREHRLDDVAVTDCRPNGIGSMLGLECRIMATDRGHRARLHRGQGLAIRKCHGGRLRLHHRPQVFGHKLAELAALPLAVVTLGQVGINGSIRGLALAIKDELAGLPAPFEGTGHDCGKGHRCQPFSGQGRLIPSGFIQGDAIHPSGQHPSGVGCGAAVPHE